MCIRDRKNIVQSIYFFICIIYILHLIYEPCITCLLYTSQSEEDSRASSFHISVSRTVHRSDTTKRVHVVHDREHTFLHFTTVPSIQNYLFFSLQVEYCSSFRVQAQFFVVVNFCFRSVETYEIRFSVVSKMCIRDRMKNMPSVNMWMTPKCNWVTISFSSV